jgi:hypothetical protein
MAQAYVLPDAKHSTPQRNHWPRCCVAATRFNHSPLNNTPTRKTIDMTELSRTTLADAALNDHDLETELFDRIRSALLEDEEPDLEIYSPAGFFSLMVFDVDTRADGGACVLMNQMHEALAVYPARALVFDAHPLRSSYMLVRTPGADLVVKLLHHSLDYFLKDFKALWEELQQPDNPIEHRWNESGRDWQTWAVE